MYIPHIAVVRQKSAAIVESWGRFDRVLQAGTYIILPWQSIAGRLSLKVQELQVNVETKTRDDVFVRLLIAVQYHVIEEKVREAFYELANPIQQIESYVFDEVRSTVPRMPLDEVFQNKDEIATAVRENLRETMTQYGYGIVRALVNDIDPDPKVKAAMNEINAATRLRKAAEERGEAERILRVKQAQGQAESTVLHGEGIAGQRRAIVDGLRHSVEEFQHGVPGVSASEVMQLILVTQYFDMLKEVGGSGKSSTIMIPHTPGGLADLMGQIRDAVTLGNVISAHQAAAGAPRGNGQDGPGRGPELEPPAADARARIRSRARAAGDSTPAGEADGMAVAPPELDVPSLPES